MTNTPCPACGHPATWETPTCEKCGQAMLNGSVPQPKKVYQKPPPPPELEGYVFEKVTPEIAALFGPINEEEMLAELQAALREYEETGGKGMGIEDIIREMEAGAPPQ